MPGGEYLSVILILLALAIIAAFVMLAIVMIKANKTKDAKLSPEEQVRQQPVRALTNGVIIAITVLLVIIVLSWLVKYLFWL